MWAKDFTLALLQTPIPTASSQENLRHVHYISDTNMIKHADTIGSTICQMENDHSISKHHLYC